jgi:hypothetical protein
MKLEEITHTATLKSLKSYPEINIEDYDNINDLRKRILFLNLNVNQIDLVDGNHLDSGLVTTFADAGILSGQVARDCASAWNAVFPGLDDESKHDPLLRDNFRFSYHFGLDSQQKPQKIQHVLVDSLIKQEVTTRMAGADLNNVQKALLRSRRGLHASTILSFAPSNHLPESTLDTPTFINGISLYCALPLNHLLNLENVRCACNRQHNVIDSYGHHVHSCHMISKIPRHNMVVSEVAEMLKSGYGTHLVHEDRQIFALPGVAADRIPDISATSGVAGTGAGTTGACGNNASRGWYWGACLAAGIPQL